MTASLKRKTRASRASWDKAIKVLEVLKGVPNEQIQAMLASGLLADIRDANYSRVDASVRDKIRYLLDLPPLQSSREESYPFTVKKIQLTVDVDESQPCVEALRQAGMWIGPFNRQEVADQYPAKQMTLRRVCVDLILFSSQRDPVVTLDEVVLWAEHQRLRRASVRTVLAIAKQWPGLHATAGVDLDDPCPVTVESLERCVVNHAAHKLRVRWCPSGRDITPDRLEEFQVNGWVAFVRE